jgi:hypothetical protein
LPCSIRCRLPAAANGTPLTGVAVDIDIGIGIGTELRSSGGKKCKGRPAHRPARDLPSLGR